MSSSDEENGSKKSRNSQSSVNMSVEGDVSGVGRKENESTKDFLRAVLGGQSEHKKLLEDIKNKMNEDRQIQEDKFEKIDEQLKKVVTRDSLQGIKEDIRKEVAADVRKDCSASFKLSLAEEIRKVERNLIVHNLGTNNARETFIDAIRATGWTEEQMSDIGIISAIKLGRNERPPYLITFRDTFKRNEILKVASKVNGLRIDRDIPVSYRAAFKKYNKKAFHLRTLLKVRTSIIFSGHMLQLRYKDEGENKGYTIVDSFFPTPQNVLDSQVNNNIVGGTNPSTSINKDTLEAAKLVLIARNPNNLSEEIMGIQLKTIMGRDFTKIANVKNQKKVTLLECRTKGDCKKLQKYNQAKDGAFELVLDALDF